MEFSLASLWAQIVASLSPLEIVAAALSAVAVALTARQHIWNFPLGIVSCLLYIIVFGKAKLYSDAGLQVFFICVCAWDWNQWARGGRGGEDLRVLRTPVATWGILGLVFVVGTLLQGFLVHRYTDAAAPYIDAGIFWASVGAQWMIGRKYIENWLIWIAVDVVATVLYWSRGLPVTSVLYAIFCGIAVWGWVEWLRSQRVQPTIAPRPDGPPIALP